MNIYIPEPCLWVGGTIAVILIVKYLANITYPGN